MNLQELSAAIAATGSEWIRPGVAVWDPMLGRLWRRCEVNKQGGWLASDAMHDSLPIWIRDDELAAPDADDYAATDELPRAIAAGPDLTDDCAALSLLAGMPDCALLPATGAGAQWRVCIGSSGRTIGHSETRAEAIAKAYILTHAKP
jgi:hypothetical protein